MNNMQLAVMRAISAHSGDPLAQIAQGLEMDRTSLYRALNPMVRDGWLKIHDAEDTRYNSARLTGKGIRVLAAAEDSWSEIHVRFKGGKTETLTTLNPKSSAQQIKTSPTIVQLVDTLLDDHIHAEIADILNERGFRPGGSARPGRGQTCFTALRVAYLVHTYALRSRYDRLRARGLVTKAEAATRLGIHEATIVPWAEHGIITRHAYNGHAYLYELPCSLPAKHSSRWDQLSDRVAVFKARKESKPSYPIERGVV